MDFEKLANNFRTFDMTDIVVKVAVLHDAELADLNTSQLEKGYLSTGERTKEYATDDYKNLKRAMGAQSLPYANLKVEGNFYAGWSVKNVNNKWIEFDSDDGKAGDLEDKFSSDIYALTEDNKGEAAEIIKEDDQLYKMNYERLTQG